jgi:tripartite-type tricarboxylate transporter receptor subunit TctC
MAAAMMASTAPCPAAYPDKPVRWILGFAPGGAPDAVARVVSQQLTT